MLVENHLEELFNFPSIVKEDKSESIRQLIWHIQTHVASLKTLNQPVDQWNTIIIHLAKKHLDFVERRDWQDHIKDRTHENMPTLEEFVKFLTERSHTLRMLKQNKVSKSNSKQAQSADKKVEKKSEKKISLSTTSHVCKYYKGNHTVNWCEEFKRLPIGERKKEVMNRKLYLNGLGYFEKNFLTLFLLT